MVVKNCLFCRTIFKVRSNEVKKGKGKFCSRICFDKYRNKGKLIQCHYCKKDKWYPTGRWKRNITGLFFCSRTCYFNSLGHRMSLYPEKEQIRKSPEYAKWRTAIFKRDNYTCVWCGQIGGTLNADHIKPFSLFIELRFNLSNGRTLCINCHRKTDSYGARVFSYEKI